MDELKELERQYAEVQARWRALFGELQNSPRDHDNIRVMNSDLLGRWVSEGKQLDRLSRQMREKALDVYGYPPNHPLRETR
jgi:hypothetical protein